MNVDREKLMAMLGGAKAVMDKVNGTDYKVDHRSLNETIGGGNVEMLSQLPQNATPQSNPTRKMGNGLKNLSTTKMDPRIVDAMVNNPMPQFEMASGGGPTFSIDDVSSLVQAQPQAQPQTYAQQVPQAQQVNETKVMNSQGKMLITLTEEELDKKIQDALLNFMSTTFTKSLTENTIKRTMNLLIKEGKLKLNPKTTK
jgi:hypothetical protein